jgi:vanillate O-demethylase ferredoxin subunit
MRQMARFGEDVWQHQEFAKMHGHWATFAIVLARWKGLAHQYDLIRSIESDGCTIFNPHTVTIEDGGMKTIDDSQIAFKRRADPLGLMNPGKTRRLDAGDAGARVSAILTLRRAAHPPPHRGGERLRVRAPAGPRAAALRARRAPGRAPARGFMRPYSLAAAPGPGAVRRYVIGRQARACQPRRLGQPARARARGRPAGRGHAAQRLCAARAGRAPPAAGRRHRADPAAGHGAAPRAHAAPSWRLAVFARSRAHLAFAEELQALRGMRRQRLHPAPSCSTSTNPARPRKLDLATLLASCRAGEHLYLCGPAGFMQQALRAASAWPEEAVHQEHFAAPEGAFDEAADEPFALRLARRGLARAGGRGADGRCRRCTSSASRCRVSCEQGVCGTCVVGLLEGRAEHRDHCLSARERATRIALCRRRAKDGELVVEL